MNKRTLESSEKHIVFCSFRKYWYLIALTILFSLFAALFEGLSIGLLVPFLRSISETSAGSFSTGIAWIDHWVLAANAPQLERLYRICGIILIATWARSGFGYLASTYGMIARATVIEDLRMRIIDQLSAVSIRFFSRTRSGEIISTLTNELQRVSHALGVVTTVIAKGFLLLAYAAFMIYVSWELSLIVLFFFALLSVLLSRLIRLIRKSGARVTRAYGRFTSAASEFVNGIRTVSAFNMQPHERGRMQGHTNELAAAIIQTSKRELLVTPLSQTVVGTVLIVVVVLAMQFYVLPGVLDVALLLAFVFALLRLIPTVNMLNQQRGQWASLHAALENVENMLRREDKPYLKDGSRVARSLRDAIVFEGVSFCYEPGEFVLKNINLRIERGKTTALVGASGAGKTTLVDLIPRFYDPTEGRILMDGVDLSTLRISSLRQMIGIVSQDAYIFNDTVRANIAYGAPDAKENDIVQAAEQANALEFISELPQGFETVMGDRGVRLSGGQRQRLAIARALLSDPEILILDEATSALDSLSEKLVQRSLERLMQGRTVVAIAHRLSTVENADHVVVLEEGEIVEQGIYSELLLRRGQLWKYHSIQFQAA